MTLERLEKLAADFFGITIEELRTNNKKSKDKVSIAKHIWRVSAVEEFGFKRTEVYQYPPNPINQSTYLNSHSIVKTKGQFKDKYDGFVASVKPQILPSTVVSNGIERITDAAYDERFYVDMSKVNPRTGNNFFPAYHFIMQYAPESPGLSKWKQDKGHFADYILKRSAEIGSYVHECCDRLIKNPEASITHEEIHSAFPDEKEAHQVKECLLGFFNFMQEEEPIIISTEKMVVGDDFAFTLDMQAYLKYDEYQKLHVVDWKTSKVASDDHKMQVEAMRRVTDSAMAMVVVLGNSTKKKYTATPVKPNDHFWNEFNAIKEVAYLDLIKSNRIKPRENPFPTVFSLKDLKIRRKF